MALLEVQHISKKFANGLSIKDISFKQEALQKIAIAGASGAGKTTLLKTISGHAQPDSGKILFNGESVIGPDEKLLPGHKYIAYLSQQYELLNNYRIEELVWFENRLDEQSVIELFKICRIDHLLKRKTDALSGGEKQRIALCLVLTKSPTLLVLDEPFSNLDLINTNILKDVLEDVTSKLKITCLLTSHEPHDMLSWADEIIILKDGEIIQQAIPEIIYNKPVNEYTAGLFGKYNLLKPHIALLFGISSNENDVLTRPENFKIHKTGMGVKGIINKINFCGSFYEAEITVNDQSIVVHTTNASLFKGDKVFVSINK